WCGVARRVLEHVIAREHRRVIPPERDDLVMAVEPGVDLPLVGSAADLGEGRSSRRGAEAEEQEAVLAADEVTDHVPIGLARRKHERVVAATALKEVLPALAVD